MAAKRLPGRARRFVSQYLVDRNGCAAAIRAGYPAVSAKQRAWELLQREDVKAAIDEADVSERTRCTVTRERFVQEATKLAFANIASYVRVVARKVRLINLADIAAMDLAAVQSITVGKDGGVTLKLHDKGRALELIGRIHGWIDDGDEKPAVRPRPRVTVPGIQV